MPSSLSAATDLGFLLHKHPDKAQSFDVAVGTAHVVWPEATRERSTVALLLEVDPIALVRGRGSQGGRGGRTGGAPANSGFSLSQYVNDRPYAASSMLAVALGKVFRTAMTGRCDARPELAGLPIPLEVHIPALPSRGEPDLVERLFAPLGWSVATTPIPLDEQLPAFYLRAPLRAALSLRCSPAGWGDSPYVALTMSAVMPVSQALAQLYVLLPVLDDSKHYWVGADEVDKLLRAGGSWLAAHPEQKSITSRYLGHHRTLIEDAVSRLAEVDDTEADETVADDMAVDALDAAAGEPERPTSLARLRTAAVVAALRQEGAATVVDLGCGEGALLRELLTDPAFSQVVGVDVSHRALNLAERRLRLDRMPDSQRARLQLLQSSATYRDDRLAGQDAIVLMEVIEHVDPPRLPALVRSVFAHARPTSVLVTTPNAEYNVRYPHLPAGAMRHRDHRFEWTREQFQGWADTTATAHGYTVDYLPVGENDAEVGAPTQMAVFRRTT